MLFLYYVDILFDGIFGIINMLIYFKINWKLIDVSVINFEYLKNNIGIRMIFW